MSECPRCDGLGQISSGGWDGRPMVCCDKCGGSGDTMREFALESEALRSVLSSNEAQRKAEADASNWKALADKQAAEIARLQQQVDEANQTIAGLRGKLAEPDRDPLLMLKIRDKIADKEMLAQRANHDAAKFGHWQCDYESYYASLNRELDALLEAADQARKGGESDDG